MLAKVEHVGLDELPRRRGEQHLPAVTRSRNACAKVDIETDVAVIGSFRGARVEAHPDSERPSAERGLARGSCGNSVGGSRERVEEGVTLSVNLDPSVAVERPRRTRRCSASTSAYRSPSSCSNLVEPSMSVKRKVTVPPGSSRTPR